VGADASRKVSSPGPQNSVDRGGASAVGVFQWSLLRRPFGAQGGRGRALNSRRRRQDFEVSAHQVRRTLEYPLAIRVLEVATREPGQRPSAKKVRNELRGDYADLQVPQVAFHLGGLRDADLLPRPIAEG
jgi:hypothetical protein